MDTRITTLVPGSTDGGVRIIVADESDSPNVVQVQMNIYDESLVNNNTVFKAGEVCSIMKNTESDIDLFIDDKSGRLYVSGDDAKHYSIDENGDLIYTYK